MLNLGGMQSISLLTGGIDYTQIIQQLTQAARAPGDAMNQTIQQYQLKKNDWGDILSLARQLQDSLDTMTNSTTFSSFTTTLTGTNSTGITASADNTAVPGTYQISVPATNGIGKNATSTSTSAIGAAVTGSTPISQAAFSQAVTTGSLSVSINGANYSYTVKSSDTVANVLDGLFGTGSNASPGNTPSPSNGPNGVTWSISNNAITITNNSGGSVTFGSSGDSSNFLNVLGLTSQQPLASGGSTQAIGPIGHAQVNELLGSSAANLGQAVTTTNGTSGSMLINGVSIGYDTTKDTVQSVINTINASTAGVSASYDATQDKVILTSKTSQPISVSDSSGNLAAVLSLPATTPAAEAGTPWTYSINGVQHTSNSATVTNVIPGVTFTIQQAGDATLTVAADTATLTKNVQAFADAFNSLYSKLKNYTQKGAALQGDAVMSQLAFKYMNDVLTDKLPNIPQQYSSDTVLNIGISNGAVGAAPGSTNSLQIDSTALAQAFQNDPNRVKSLITSMAQNINRDLVSLTGNFNQTWLEDPYSNSVSSTLTALGTSEQSMYDTMISNVEKQQQSIYDQADQQAQTMQVQFTQLQQYQAQVSMQMSAIRAMTGMG